MHPWKMNSLVIRIVVVLGYFAGGDAKGDGGPLGGWDDEVSHPLGDSIPGIPGRSYPNHDRVPDTGFDCRTVKDPGYYADTGAQCQVYHVCQSDGRQDSFLCPVGTLFSQETFVCDWWFNVDCGLAQGNYHRNAHLHRGPGIGIDGRRVDRQGDGVSGDQQPVGIPTWGPPVGWNHPRDDPGQNNPGIPEQSGPHMRPNGQSGPQTRQKGQSGPPNSQWNNAKGGPSVGPNHQKGDPGQNNPGVPEQSGPHMRPNGQSGPHMRQKGQSGPPNSRWNNDKGGPEMRQKGQSGPQMTQKGHSGPPNRWNNDKGGPSDGRNMIGGGENGQSGPHMRPNGQSGPHMRQKGESGPPNRWNNNKGRPSDGRTMNGGRGNGMGRNPAGALGPNNALDKGGRGTAGERRNDPIGQMNSNPRQKNGHGHPGARNNAGGQRNSKGNRGQGMIPRNNLGGQRNNKGSWQGDRGQNKGSGRPVVGGPFGDRDSRPNNKGQGGMNKGHGPNKGTSSDGNGRPMDGQWNNGKGGGMTHAPLMARMGYQRRPQVGDENRGNTMQNEQDFGWRRRNERFMTGGGYGQGPWDQGQDGTRFVDGRSEPNFDDGQRDSDFIPETPWGKDAHFVARQPHPGDQNFVENPWRENPNFNDGPNGGQEDIGWRGNDQVHGENHQGNGFNSPGRFDRDQGSDPNAFGVRFQANRWSMDSRHFQHVSSHEEGGVSNIQNGFEHEKDHWNTPGELHDGDRGNEMAGGSNGGEAGYD